MKKYDILDHGFIRVVDTMGDDSSIVQAARVSYGDGTKSKKDDVGLIRYLMKHKHCYHPSMEVLTRCGWKRWDECSSHESYAVPDLNGNVTFEWLPTKTFNHNGIMCNFKSGRMSYSVTENHKMFFKGKHQSNYSKVEAGTMSKWGSFYSIKNFSKQACEFDASSQLVGFFLGDGCAASKTSISFHLKKTRKIKYLTNILNVLKLPYTKRVGSDGCTTIRAAATDEIKRYTNFGAKSTSKDVCIDGMEADAVFLQSILDGLINSDGYCDPKRPRWIYCSYSKSLLKKVETIAALLGYHGVILKNNTINITYKSTTELESRKQYHSTTHYQGKVYCTTTSTGLLFVRGCSQSEGFVCGNSSPFEMCEIKLHIKLPIFIARQWIRHRTANVNECSARYSILPEEYYIPAVENIAPQSAQNKQCRGGEISIDEAKNAQKLIEESSKRAYQDYTNLLGSEDGSGIAREIARGVLPLNMYTEWYWKIDLHNLLHFIQLRIHPHAQYEIRVYAQKLAEIVKEWCPIAFEAYVEYREEAITLSGTQKKYLRYIIEAISGRMEHTDLVKKDVASFRGIITDREYGELKDNFDLEFLEESLNNNGN